MITFVLATLVGILLAILASKQHRIHELENSDYRKDERIFGLKGENRRLGDSVERLTAENLSQKKNHAGTEAILKATIKTVTAHYVKLRTYVRDVEVRMHDARAKKVEYETRSTNLLAANQRLEEQVKILFRLARSLAQEKATRKVGEGLLELLRKVWPQAA
jgi:chromosome segregation ATPase